MDPRQRALAMGLEFSKRALEAESLEDLFFMLTNDVRSLLEFDRAFLITHMGGKTEFSAASNQPLVEKKSQFTRRIMDLGKRIKPLDRGLLLSSKSEAVKVPDENIAPDIVEELYSFIEFSGADYIFCVPLNHREVPMGHLVLEFIKDKPPERVQILTLLNMAPFFGAALAEKWLIWRKPSLMKMVTPQGGALGKILKFSFITLPLMLLLLAGLIIGLFFVPTQFTVGGEAEVVPKKKRLAFAKMDGLVKEILVVEGQEVSQGQILATMDQKELDYQINSAQRKFDILTKEIIFLRRESTEDPAKLAESKLVELKRKSAWEELQFLKYKTGFLEIHAPVSGTIVSKDIQSFVGKRFKSGEPFCEIAEPGEIWVDTLVPEEKISYVSDGLKMEMYLNSNPRIGYEMTVDRIAPIAQTAPRAGNVFRVSGAFTSAPAFVKVGMKGIGKIYVGETNLWFIISERLATRWNKLTLYF
jgi:multidrug resistance efflux pump